MVGPVGLRTFIISYGVLKTTNVMVRPRVLAISVPLLWTIIFLEEDMAIHSKYSPWRIPWPEEPIGWSTESQRIRLSEFRVAHTCTGY